MSYSSQKVVLSLISFLILFANINCDFSGWSVDNEDGNICLMVEMDIKINVTYKTLDDKSVFGNYIIPNNSTRVDKTASKCGTDENTLVVAWDGGNNFTMTFTKENNTYDLSSIVIMINTSYVFSNNSAANQTEKIEYKDDASIFKTMGNFSYHCYRDEILNHTTSLDSITISKVQFEAFRTSKTKVFSLAKDCDSNIKPDIVPIAVGLSLIALIIIVLVAYIVGRRRQQARGYLNIM